MERSQLANGDGAAGIGHTNFHGTHQEHITDLGAFRHILRHRIGGNDHIALKTAGHTHHADAIDNRMIHSLSQNLLTGVHIIEIDVGILSQIGVLGILRQLGIAVEGEHELQADAIGGLGRLHIQRCSVVACKTVIVIGAHIGILFQTELLAVHGAHGHNLLAGENTVIGGEANVVANLGDLTHGRGREGGMLCIGDRMICRSQSLSRKRIGILHNRITGLVLGLDGEVVGGICLQIAHLEADSTGAGADFGSRATFNRCFQSFKVFIHVYRIGNLGVNGLVILGRTPHQGDGVRGTGLDTHQAGKFRRNAVQLHAFQHHDGLSLAIQQNFAVKVRQIGGQLQQHGVAQFKATHGGGALSTYLAYPNVKEIDQVGVGCIIHRHGSHGEHDVALKAAVQADSLEIIIAGDGGGSYAILRDGVISRIQIRDTVLRNTGHTEGKLHLHLQNVCRCGNRHVHCHSVIVVDGSDLTDVTQLGIGAIAFYCLRGGELIIAAIKNRRQATGSNRHIHLVGCKSLGVFAVKSRHLTVNHGHIAEQGRGLTLTVQQHLSGDSRRVGGQLQQHGITQLPATNGYHTALLRPYVEEVDHIGVAGDIVRQRREGDDNVALKTADKAEGLEEIITAHHIGGQAIFGILVIRFTDVGNRILGNTGLTKSKLHLDGDRIEGVGNRHVHRHGIIAGDGGHLTAVAKLGAGLRGQQLVVGGKLEIPVLKHWAEGTGVGRDIHLIRQESLRVRAVKRHYLAAYGGGSRPHKHQRGCHTNRKESHRANDS